MRRTALAAISLASLLACQNEPLPSPRIDFLIEAPLCSMTLPVSMTIDGTQVGVDTLVVNYGPPHERTRAFETTPGNHQLAVRFFPNGNMIQEDSVVTLAAGDTYTFRFGFYCS